MRANFKSSDALLCFELGLLTYGFVHAKVKNPIFNKNILGFLWRYYYLFQCFKSTIKNRVKFIWVENPEIPRIQPTYSLMIGELESEMGVYINASELN